MSELRREVILPRDEAHWLQVRAECGDITSTTVSALFGMNERITKFELWHRLRGGVVVADEGDERTAWGKLLQESIAKGVARERDWLVAPMPEYVRLPTLRIGSSFDYRVVGQENAGGGLLFMRPTEEPSPDDAILEVKNVDGLIFKNQWIEEEGYGITAPATIEIQVAHEMLVSDLRVAFIAALVGGNRLVLLRRERQADVDAAIIAACAAFWSSDEPEPDFNRDARFIAKSLYGVSDEGSVLDADEEIASLFREYAGYRAQAKAADDNADAAKAKILTRIGSAERVLHPDWSLSTKMVKATHVSYDRAAYRGFRLTEKTK